MRTKGKCVCWPLAPPSTGRKLAGTAFKVSLEKTALETGELAPEDGLTALNCYKDSRVRRKVNGKCNISGYRCQPATALRREHVLRVRGSPALNGAAFRSQTAPYWEASC